jgi:hypothetical protein
MIKRLCTLLINNFVCFTSLIAEEVVVLDKELQELLALNVEYLTTVLEHEPK